MKNKKIHIIIFFLVIALLICASISVYKIVFNKSKDENVIDIDCVDEDCNKSPDDKKGTEDNKNKKDNSKSPDNKGNSGSGSGNGNGSGSGSGSGDGNGSGSGSGSGTGPSDSGESGTGDSGSSDVPAENLIVNDNDHKWSKITNLDIFKIDTVAPGDYGTYDFAISNSTGKNVNYSIMFDEHNQYNANIKYKLKRNNEYISGDIDSWVYYDELDFSDKILNSNNKDSYTLEWEWVSNDNDTAVGRIRGATYSIDVLIDAHETSGIDPDGGSDGSGSGSGSGSDGSGSGGLNPFTGDNILHYVELLIVSALAILILILKRKNSEDNESV